MFDRLDALILVALTAGCGFGAVACGPSTLPTFANPPDPDSGTDSGALSDAGSDDEDSGAE